MAYNSDFDVEAVMKTLGTISDKYQKDSPEDEALRIAAVALLYVRDIQKPEDYRTYFREFVTGKPIIVSQTFSTREEADEWLGGTEPPSRQVRPQVGARPLFECEGRVLP